MLDVSRCMEHANSSDDKIGLEAITDPPAALSSLPVRSLLPEEDEGGIPFGLVLDGSKSFRFGRDIASSWNPKEKRIKSRFPLIY